MDGCWMEVDGCSCSVCARVKVRVSFLKCPLRHAAGVTQERYATNGRGVNKQVPGTTYGVVAMDGQDMASGGYEG